MLSVIWTYIQSVEDDADKYMAKEHVHEILKLIENEGMSPPGYPVDILDGDIEFVYEWEPEDETK